MYVVTTEAPDRDGRGDATHLRPDAGEAREIDLRQRQQVEMGQELIEVGTEARQQLFNAGMEVVGAAPQELARVMKADMAKMGKVIKQAGIRADF